MMRSLRTSFLFAFAAVFSALATPASAEVYTLQFTQLVDGFLPGGTDIATMTIEDNGLDSVLITLTHNATSDAGQFISDLWFNVEPYVAPSQSNQTPLGQFDTFYAGMDSQPNALMRFDLRQTFLHNAGNRFDPGESISFVLTASGLNASDFLVPATPEMGGLDYVTAMIHVQGVGTDGLNSGKLAVVPEPASLAVIGLGLAALLRRQRTAR
jgi:hypothetical protein